MGQENLQKPVPEAVHDQTGAQSRRHINTVSPAPKNLKILGAQLRRPVENPRPDREQETVSSPRGFILCGIIALACTDDGLGPVLYLYPDLMPLPVPGSTCRVVGNPVARPEIIRDFGVG